MLNRVNERRRHQRLRILYMPIQAFIRRFILHREGVRLASRPAPPSRPAKAPEPSQAQPAMPSLPWKSGILRIDEQHEDMFNAIRKLQAAIKAGAGASGVADVLAFLERYTEDHFILEEAYMESLRFPGLDEHRREHRSFRLQVRELRQRLTAGEADLGLELTTLLYDWLREHVLREDLLYCEYARSNPRK